MEYASNAKGNLAVTLGSIGTGLSVLNGGLGLLGMNPGQTQNIEDRHVTRHEMDLIREIMAKDQTIAIKDSEAYTDQKLVEVYSQLAKQDKDINARIDANAKEQANINLVQATYNATNNANIGCLQGQVAALQAMTKLVIPSDNVCPKPMPQFNSWTAPTT